MTEQPRVYKFTFPGGEVIKIFSRNCHDVDCVASLAMNEAKWRDLKFEGVVVT